MSAVIDVVDGCAGPGGWSRACHMFGLREVGIELDPHACDTRRAAGHLTVRADITLISTHRLRRLAGRIRGLIFSPPCGTFSAAGLREGIGDMALLHQALDDLAAGRDTRAELAAACSDPRTPLVVEPLRYALAIRPEWITLEQVPAVLPLWEHIARILRTEGYSTWTGILNAADYGVPQTRRRAILIASRARTVAPPEPTHAKSAEPETLFGPGRQRWVSMAEALGWTGTLAEGVVNTRGERTTPGGNEFSPGGPSWALTEKTRSWVLKAGDREKGTARTVDEPASTLVFGNHSNNGIEWVPTEVDVRAGGHAAGYRRSTERPSPTVTGHVEFWMLRNNTQANASTRALDEPAGTMFFDARGNDVSWVNEDESKSVRISIPEAAVLQTFPADYPWQGTKTNKFLQVGNAVPPRLAAAVIGAATGLDWQSAVESEYAPTETKRGLGFELAGTHRPEVA